MKKKMKVISIHPPLMIILKRIRAKTKQVANAQKKLMLKIIKKNHKCQNMNRLNNKRNK